MIPNIDPKTLKSVMARLGISSKELQASKVVIELADKEIVIENPQITLIEAGGAKSFEITGDIVEKAKEEEAVVEIKDEDVQFVADNTGASKEEAKKALEESNGDIAKAISLLRGPKDQKD